MKGPAFHRQLRFCLPDRLAQEAAEGQNLSSIIRLAQREWLGNRWNVTRQLGQ